MPYVCILLQSMQAIKFKHKIVHVEVDIISET